MHIFSAVYAKIGFFLKLFVGGHRATLVRRAYKAPVVALAEQNEAEDGQLEEGSLRGMGDVKDVSAERTLQEAVSVRAALRQLFEKPVRTREDKRAIQTLNIRWNRFAPSVRRTAFNILKGEII